MLRILFSVFLGILSPFMFILGASPFENRYFEGAEILAGSITLFLYLALVQYLLQKARLKQLEDRLPVAIGMLTPLLLVAGVIAIFEKRDVFIHQGIPLLVAGLGGLSLGLFSAHYLKSDEDKPLNRDASDAP